MLVYQLEIFVPAQIRPDNIRQVCIATSFISSYHALLFWLLLVYMDCKHGIISELRYITPSKGVRDKTGICIMMQEP